MQLFGTAVVLLESFKCSAITIAAGKYTSRSNIRGQIVFKGENPLINSAPDQGVFWIVRGYVGPSHSYDISNERDSDHK